MNMPNSNEIKGTDEERLLRVEHVARYLDVSRKRVYHLIEQGRLEAFRLGDRQWRISPEALERFLLDCPGRRPDLDDEMNP